MSEVYLPMPREGKTIEEKVQFLTDVIYRYRKELDFLLNNLDEENVIRAGSVYAENIDTVHAKISVAQIENLEVGGNVTMGPNAILSWGQVSNKPWIPQTAADLGALTNTQLTTILGQDYVVTGKVWANQINGGVANLAEGVNIGDVNLIGEKTLTFYNTGSPSTSCSIRLKTDGSLSISSFQAINMNQGGGNQITIDDNMIFLNSSVMGLESAYWEQPPHNHGIPNGTRLGICDAANNVIGTVIWTESGGFMHNHAIY